MSQVLAIDSSGRISAYLLNYRVDYSLVSADKKPLLQNQSVKLQREYDFDRLNVLASEKQSEFLQGEMRRDVAQQSCAGWQDSVPRTQSAAMQINADQLTRQLERGLAPLYLVSGDEPLQVEESGDAIRRRAEAGGCSERSVFTVEPGFDWDGLRTATQSLSLFAERRLIELRLPTGRPGEAGAALLSELAGNASADIVLLGSRG